TAGITEEERARIGDPPTGRGVLGLLITERRIVRIEDIASHPRSVGFPPNHPRMRSFLGGPVTARGRVYGNIYLTEKRGAPAFTEEDERALEILAAQAGVAIENARLYEEAQRRARWLDAVREIANEVLAGADADHVLATIADRARELAGADLATIAVPARPDELEIRAAVGAHAAELLGATFPIEGSVSGEVMRTGRSETLADAAADLHRPQPIVRLGDLGPAILVPLTGPDRALGTLAVANLRGGRPFTDEDLRLVETFASQAALALEHDLAQRERQRLVVLEDRERIAKELHDGAIQALFAVGMGLEAAAALSSDAEVSKRIEGAVEELDRVIRDLRNYIFGLRPGILADRQLDQALRDLAEGFQERSGVITVVDVDPEIAAELSTKAAGVVQMAREALSNVGRHAEATTCRLSLRRDGHRAVLEIDDDGRGFDPAAARTGGQGLGNLRDRARALGGDASVESVPGEGTTVRVRLPL
ncbi:MAG TPA: GAF domain-containing sensor histidine kinase, partial [Actinomycetota bacterium]|nr:GAF domain-containing sensor histidine kinase [Actinomycetota bacterium]